MAPAPSHPRGTPGRPPRAVGKAGRPQAGAPASSSSRKEQAAPGGPAPRSREGSPVTRLWRRIEGEPDSGSNSSYYMILGSSLALTLIGLIMVLSSSAVEAISRDTSSYSLFLKQGLLALVGFVLMVVMSRLQVATIRRLAWPAIFLALGLLLLVFVPGLGVEVYGNRNWIAIGGFTAQPSEAAKLALAVWSAHIIATKSHLMGQTSHVLVPVVFPGAALVLGLVLLGRDLGTALVIGLVLVAALFLGGVRLKLFGIAAAIGAAGAILMVAVSGNRMGRINAWLGDGCETDPDSCYQSRHGLYALASGGWWGVGLGQSRQKWNYIPEAENDFIFAIIGEELGLLGTGVVIVLFGILAVAMYRVAARHDDLFVRITTGAIMAWLVGQAFVNIGMVTGLLPVIGVPLPFISYGGSALTIALTAVGVVLAFARSAPNPYKTTESGPA